jgi:hypothetical protein
MTSAPFKLYYFSAGTWHLYGTYDSSARAKAAGGDLSHPWRHQPATWLKPEGDPSELISETLPEPIIPDGRHEPQFPRREQ